MTKCEDCGKEQYKTPPGIWYIDMYYHSACEDCGSMSVVCASCTISHKKCRSCKRDKKLEEIIE
jgi:hypothetical protein